MVHFNIMVAIKQLLKGHKICVNFWQGRYNAKVTTFLIYKLRYFC